MNANANRTALAPIAQLSLAVLLAACGNVATNSPTPSTSGTSSSSGGVFNGGSSGGASSSSSGGTSSSSGASTTDCTPMQRQCGSLQELSTCNAAGKWETAACSAGQVCDDAECLPKICEAGAVTCDGAKIMKCSPRGTRLSVVDVCVGKKVCAGGECIKGTCAVGASKCVGDAVVTCGEEKEWVPQQCSANESCAVTGSGADAVAKCVGHVCEPSASTCENNKAFSCSADGLTKTIAADCSEAGKDGGAQVCLNGGCVAKACAAGAKKCTSEGVAVCKDDFSGWQVTPCEGGLACGGEGEAIACKKLVCAAKEVFCDGLDVMKCDATGTSKTKVQSCNGNLQECKQGGCVDLAIVCGDGFCDEGESVDNCDKDCTEKITVSPTFDTLPTKAKLAKPRAPRALVKSMPHASYTSSSMALGGKWLYVVDRDNGTLVLMDRKTLEVGHTLKVGTAPEHVVVAPDGTAWISVKDDDAIVKLEAGATTMDKAVKWQVGTSPKGMALDKSGAILLVALMGENAVIGIDPAKGTEVARATTGIMPHGVTIGVSGVAMVTHNTGQISKIDVNAMKAGNALQPIKVSAASINLRVDNPVMVCRGLKFVKQRKPSRALGAALQPESGMMLVGHVLANTGTAQDVLDAAGPKPKVKVPKPKVVTVCSSSGYGSTCKTTVIPPPEPCMQAPVRPYEVSMSMYAPNLGFMQPTKGVSAMMDPQTKRSFLARFDQPMGVVHHPTMTMALVPMMGTNNVMVVNTAAPDPMMWPIADIKAGSGPKTVVIAPDGKTAWVHNATGFSVSKVDLAPLLKFNDPLTQGKDMPKIDPLFMQADKAVPFAKDPLGEKGNLGRQVFHNALNGRLNASNRFACATCHLDGMEDKNVWFIAEGPRQTPALAGRLKDTAPFNWMGTKFTLQDNMKSTTTRMGGTGLKQFELDALEHFVKEGLQAPRNPHVKPTGLTAQEQEGKKLFFDPLVGCSGCHSGPSLTDGAQHDVGTATPVEVKVQTIFAGNDPPKKVVFNTPSLRGLFYTAPYLHDGSAPTLKDALKKTAKTMGRTDHLSEKQLDALVAYLLTL